MFSMNFLIFLYFKIGLFFVSESFRLLCESSKKRSIRQTRGHNRCFIMGKSSRPRDWIEIRYYIFRKGTIYFILFLQNLNLLCILCFDNMTQEHEIDKPEDVYSLLSKSVEIDDEVAVEVNDDNKQQSGNKTPAPLFQYHKFAAEGGTDIMKMVLRKHISAEDIKRLSKDLKHILYK